MLDSERQRATERDEHHFSSSVPGMCNLLADLGFPPLDGAAARDMGSGVGFGPCLRCLSVWNGFEELIRAAIRGHAFKFAILKMV